MQGEKVLAAWGRMDQTKSSGSSIDFKIAVFGWRRFSRRSRIRRKGRRSQKGREFIASRILASWGGFVL